MVTGKAGEKFLAKGGSLLPAHGLGFAVVFGVHAPSDEFEGTRGDGEQGFALEKVEKVAVENGVDLQAVAAVFDDVRIDEAGDGALAKEGLAEALGQKSGQVVGGRSGFGV